jgi:M6 family metalloprotease-like protein
LIGVRFAYAIDQRYTQNDRVETLRRQLDPDSDGHIIYSTAFGNGAPWQGGSGEKKVLMLMVEFPDRTHRFYRDSIEKAWIAQKSLSVSTYFGIASNSSLAVGLGSHGAGDWMMLDKKYSTYLAETDDYDILTYALINDCLALARAKGIDLTEYDGDANGLPDISVILFPGISIRAGGDMIGGFALTDANQSVVMIAEEYTFGDFNTSLLIHELAHAVVGMPDLYDYSKASMPIFGWDVMGDGLWQGYCGLSSFTRWHSGWIDLKWLEEPGEYIVDDLNGNGQNKAYGVKIPGSDKEWLLIEFRQKTGLDTYHKGTPSEGLVVYLVDDKREYGYAFNTLSKDLKTHGIRFLKCLKPNDVITPETLPSTNPYVKIDRTVPNLGIRNVSRNENSMMFSLSLEKPRLPVALVPDKVYCGKVVKGTKVSVKIPFANIGAGTLHVILQSRSKYVTLDRKSFIGNDEIVIATVDAKGLAMGTYTADLAYSNRSSEINGSIEIEFEVSSIHGDLDKNDIVNDVDLVSFEKLLGLKGDDPLFNPDADFDSNGVIDFEDLCLLAKNFNNRKD